MPRTYTNKVREANVDKDKTLTQMIQDIVERTIRDRVLTLETRLHEAAVRAGEFAGRKAGKVAGHDAGLKAGYEAGHQAAMTEIGMAMTSLNPNKEEPKEPRPGPARRFAKWHGLERELLIEEVDKAIAQIALKHERSVNGIWVQMVRCTHKREVDQWRT